MQTSLLSWPPHVHQTSPTTQRIFPVAGHAVALVAVKKLDSVRCDTAHICCVAQLHQYCLTHAQRHALSWHCLRPSQAPPQRRPLGRIGSIPTPTFLNNRIGVSAIYCSSTSNLLPVRSLGPQTLTSIGQSILATFLCPLDSGLFLLQTAYSKCRRALCSHTLFISAAASILPSVSVLSPEQRDSRKT